MDNNSLTILKTVKDLWHTMVLGWVLTVQYLDIFKILNLYIRYNNWYCYNNNKRENCIAPQNAEENSEAQIIAHRQDAWPVSWGTFVEVLPPVMHAGDNPKQ